MTDSIHSSSTPSERRRRLEPVLRHVLASLPRDAAYTTAQLAAMLAPRLPEQANYLSTDLVALANALPGLCRHSDPELQTVGVNKGRMIRRKTWGLLPGGHTFNREQSRILSGDPLVAGVVERLYADPPEVPDALTDALKRIDRLERLLISFGYQLPPLKD